MMNLSISELVQFSRSDLSEIVLQSPKTGMYSAISSGSSWRLLTSGSFGSSVWAELMLTDRHNVAASDHSETFLKSMKIGILDIFWVFWLGLSIQEFSGVAVHVGLMR